MSNLCCIEALARHTLPFRVAAALGGPNTVRSGHSRNVHKEVARANGTSLCGFCHCGQLAIGYRASKHSRPRHRQIATSGHWELSDWPPMTVRLAITLGSCRLIEPREG